MSLPHYTTLSITLENHVAQIILNRPDRANAMNEAMWRELKEAMHWLDEEPTARVAILSGNGANFCAGIDFSMLMAVQNHVQDECQGRQAEKLRRLIMSLQDSLSAIERCRKPVIAAIHGACVGGGLDLIAACDLRYCSVDAHFCLKEVDLGIVADVGVLQRLPMIIGDGRTRELAFTAREITGKEAMRYGLTAQCLSDRDSLLMEVMTIADTIAAKPPLTVRGIKDNLNYARDHSVEEGLRYVATWNAAMLVSKDLEAAALAQITKQVPSFLD
ncbi:crotonase/enoyl-CoA hydratase family protein [Chitinimonas sp. BJB300]|uniref:crotonase/enoyl-CoA hydratase family protein n=1 Tax=Chitinimonas sp. BJB300 TaxID=1559339 RepID=UPI000C106357|nr:crotonase/enoyl-CoA hydratase family protein [Chitinimonas sp. BJB300]PHV12373.1 enoyl-CoA hydratase [Chitinimonas sp. BJB300]TSJ91083.1 crotonase/enoyl-CoA hydratase family protein [Chitinimonas sp. BJB300]